MAGDGAILRCRELRAGYEEVEVLRGVSLELHACKVACVVGRNGAGKSTLLGAMIGWVRVFGGSIVYMNQEISHLHPWERVRLGLSIVPQGRRIFGDLTVSENLLLGRRINRAWTMEDVYRMFPPLKAKQKLRGCMLSGGEQQMLAIARALLTNPSLLLMDEPSEGLSPVLQREIVAIIRGLKERDVSVLLAEQNIYLALEVADVLYVMDKGAIIRCFPCPLTPSQIEEVEGYVGIPSGGSAHEEA